MIYLIHGQSQVDSRRFLIRLKEDYQEIQQIPGKDLNAATLKRDLSRLSYSLFGGKAAILIENFAGDWQIFPKKLPEGVDLILWSDAKIEIGDLPVKNFLFDRIKKATSFKLADAILFRREKEAQILVSQILNAKEPVEKVIGALGRGFALVYCAKEESLLGANLAAFVRERVEDQARFWSKSALKKALLQLLLADIALKGGARPHLVFTALISQVVSL